LDLDFLDLTALGGGDELAEGDRRVVGLLGIEDLQQKKEHQTQDQPQGDISRKLIHHHLLKYSSE
jgi:hypothetical protein